MQTVICTGKGTQPHHALPLQCSRHPQPRCNTVYASNWWVCLHAGCRQN